MGNTNENAAITTGTLASVMSFFALLSEHSNLIYLLIVFLSFIVSIVFHIISFYQKERQIRLLEKKILEKKDYGAQPRDYADSQM